VDSSKLSLLISDKPVTWTWIGSTSSNLILEEDATFSKSLPLIVICEELSRLPKEFAGCFSLSNRPFNLVLRSFAESVRIVSPTLFESPSGLGRKDRIHSIKEIPPVLISSE